MAKKADELPLMDEFTESSLLDALEPEEEENDETNKGGDNDPDPNPDPDPDPDPDEDENPDPDEDPEESKKTPKAKKGGDDEDEEDDEPQEETFWSDVEKLTGRAVEVDYGDVEPESPEGAALREEALVQGAINDHLDYLSKLFPREFRALEHAANGGSIDELYSPSEPDFTKMQIPEDDEAYGQAFMENYYQRKGFDQNRAKRLAAADADSEEGITKIAKEALAELASEQEKTHKQKFEEQKQKNQQQQQADMQMIGAVEKVVQTGKLNRFTVPTKEREEFYQFSLQHMQRNPQGGYMFVTPVDPQSLEEQLQEMYFAYKRGDLSKIIQREVKTEGARRLKRTIGSGGKKKGGSAEDDANRNKRGLPTMDDYTS